ncbi:MAG: mandelate racemase/muconate lactonizing enzyme family protein [Peptococcaceae bacterium]|nr:mandelate racemase/muconate lactonizing enzyme family protein [Peptococcaceae bacterium]
MPDLIKDVEVFAVRRRLETPMFDANLKMEWTGNTVVRLITESGLEGWGMADGSPIAEFILRRFREAVIGSDPLANEEIWSRMFQLIRPSGRKGVALIAMSAIDIAVWDLRGKLLGLPVYRLLGGADRLIPVYASVGFLSMPEDEVVEKSLEYVREGIKTLKIKIGYDNGRNIAADVRRVKKVRDAVGRGIEIIVDANGVYDAATAVRFAKAAADMDISLFEEPTHADDIAGLRRIRDTGLIPVASGENEYTKYGCRDMVIAEAVDVLQFDITRVGGVTEMMKAAAIAQAWNVKLAPHFYPQFSAHILSAAPNGLYLEVFPENLSKPIITNQPPIAGGFYEIPEAPGMGLEFDSEYVSAFKFSL